MNRPTVTARHETPSATVSSVSGQSVTYPGAVVEVTYEEGDHAGALAALGVAYGKVRAQILASQQQPPPR